MRTFVAALLGALLLMIGPGPATAQETPVQTLLQTFRAEIEQSSRRTIGPAIDAIAGSGLARAQEVLLRWQAREMWLRKSDGLFYLAPNGGATPLHSKMWTVVKPLAMLRNMIWIS